MDFKNNKTIFLQIAERICDEILLEKYKPDGRIPSVREYASIVEVNFNTVMRSFEYLQQSGIIFNKRGIGYFVSPDAAGKILAIQKTEFLENEIYDYFKRIFLLNIPMEEIVERYNNYVKQQVN
jgi:DNA-binding transcriptional regulator YhcF (GntR family)